MVTFILIVIKSIVVFYLLNRYQSFYLILDVETSGHVLKSTLTSKPVENNCIS